LVEFKIAKRKQHDMICFLFIGRPMATPKSCSLGATVRCCSFSFCPDPGRVIYLICLVQVTDTSFGKLLRNSRETRSYNYTQLFYQELMLNTGVMVRVMVFNATFNNNSVMSWRSVLLVEETEYPEINHRPAACH
jgi:hypothetical protein